MKVRITITGNHACELKHNNSLLYSKIAKAPIHKIHARCQIQLDGKQEKVTENLGYLYIRCLVELHQTGRNRKYDESKCVGKHIQRSEKRPEKNFDSPCRRLLTIPLKPAQCSEA
ncbi:hypothetical protein V6Z88_005672 [Aspergillus fumigatus]